MEKSKEELRNEHVAIVKQLLQGETAQWEVFFFILGGISGKGGYLARHYERRLREECSNATLEDFCQHLQEYLLRKNNYILATLIEIHQHFFEPYFLKVLKDVYADFFRHYGDRRIRENRRRQKIGQTAIQMIPLDQDEFGNLHEKIAAPEPHSELMEKLPLFANSPRKLWKQNQKSYLSVWMYFILHCNQNYIQQALGYPSENSVARRLADLRKRQMIAYSADGTSRAELLDQWLKHSISLFFASDSGKLTVIFHIPCDCTPPEDHFIRVELVRNNGKPISQATIHFGKISCNIAHGRGELNLADFHKALKLKRGCVKVVDRNQNEMEVFPVYQKEEPLRILTDEMFAKWNGKNADLLHFQTDFGTGLAWLLNSSLEYERYGAFLPFQYAHLKTEPGEAMVVMAADFPWQNGVLPEYGFVFPLEWRKMPDGEDPHSSLLPEPLTDLARKIAAEQPFSSGWGLHPSFRFFHDRVDFSRQTVIAGSDENVASAYLALSAALILGKRNYATPGQLFASAQWDWENGGLQRVDLLEKKLRLAAAWETELFFVAEEQENEAKSLIKKYHIPVKPVGISNPLAAFRMAFYGLEPLRPKSFSPLKTVPDLEYKMPRPELLPRLSALVNAAWDKKNQDGMRRNSFVILSGNPGMGKSILMADLFQRYQKCHAVTAFACNASDRNCAENFIRSISHQLASQSAAFAAAALGNLEELSADAEIRELYRKLLWEPLIRTASKNQSKRHYLLVDGVDEDASGMISQLLADPAMPFPRNYAIVISCRPIAPLMELLKARATGLLDLDSPEYAAIFKKDLEKFIINYVYHHETVRRCWQNSGYNDEKLRKKIAGKDTSYLYAQYVLQGVADGMYHFEQLDQELPAGLTAYYAQSFRHRFPDPAEYETVKPLLKLLLNRKSVSVEEASRHLETPVGKLVKSMKGYCVVNEGKLSFCDATLRDWLSNSLTNPDFSVF